MSTKTSFLPPIHFPSMKIKHNGRAWWQIGWSQPAGLALETPKWKNPNPHSVSMGETLLIKVKATCLRQTTHPGEEKLSCSLVTHLSQSWGGEGTGSWLRRPDSSESHNLEMGVGYILFRPVVFKLFRVRNPISSSEIPRGLSI